jgi:PAS domain S-box-containing protein
VDESQRITLFNRGAEQIFGYAAEEVIGQSLNLLIPPRFRDVHEDVHMPKFARSHVAARRMGERGEVYGRRKSGEEFPAEASISRIEVGGTRIFNAVLRDISERRRVEAELRRKAEELARSNRELEQFAYVASHDLQEPLRMVASYTQLLSRRYAGTLDAQADKYIEYAVDGARRMQALINDLLALSRVGTQGKPFAPTDVNAVLARVLRTGDALVRESGAVVTSGTLPTVHADAGQLEQVLQNLIFNALKFRGDEPPRVHVSAAREDGAWHFSVRDNGIGLDMEFADRIFVIFQRLHGRDQYGGTGIGLAICRKIIERHGGRIWVESAPGAGATFHFTIPEAR